VSDVFRVDPALGAGGVIAGAFLAFYAFIGFEDMVNVSEEVKNPRKTMPLAILLSLLISTVLYILVVVIAISIVSPQELSASSAPLALVYERTGSRGVIGLTAIGLVAAVNGIIVQIIMGSRVLYGLSKQGWIHRKFTQLHTKNQTPAFATVFIVAIMILATLLLPIVSLAKTTSLLLLGIFVLVNASLIAVKRKHKNHTGYITVPMFIPVLGAVSAASLIVYQLLRP
jgi:amino acid transporter